MTWLAECDEAKRERDEARRERDEWRERQGVQAAMVRERDAHIEVILRERDEALAKHCECSAEDACKFARERDEARDAQAGLIKAWQIAEARAAKLETALAMIRDTWACNGDDARNMQAIACDALAPSPQANGCPDCDGTGTRQGWPHGTCPTCNGSGRPTQADEPKAEEPADHCEHGVPYEHPTLFCKPCMDRAFGREPKEAKP